jgi:hypothetical protein
LNIYISYFVTENYKFLTNKFISSIKKVILLKRYKTRRKYYQKKYYYRLKTITRSNYKVLSKVKAPNKLKKYFFRIRKYDILRSPLKLFVKRLKKEEITVRKMYVRKKLKLKVLYNKQNINNLLFYNLLKGLMLFTNNNYKIKLIFNCLNKKNSYFFIDRKQKRLLKEKLALISRKYERTEFFREGFNILFNVISNKNSANLLARFLTLKLKKIKRQNFFLNFIKKCLILFLNSKFSKLKGAKIILKGRLNGKLRAKHKTLKIGDTPIQTISANINYATSTYITATGSYGIKVWLHYKT